MENKINIAELLEDCPMGMELDCPLYDNVTLGYVLEGKVFPIKVQTPEGSISLTKDGCYSLNKHAKCIIFPKGKTTWEGFQRPFKDGDVVAYSSNDKDAYIFIFKEYINIKGNYAMCHMMMGPDGIIDFSEGAYYITRFATEEEKQKLFDAIKNNGYKWNAETKTLEKLIEPKFKGGIEIKLRDWINVEDRLPRTGERVMVCQSFNDGSAFARMATRVKVNQVDRWYNDDGFEVEYITHWQPIILPKKK